MLLYTYISRFPVNPHYQQQLYLRPSFIVFFSLSHKWPMFAFTSESGYTLGFRRKIAHKGTHGETGGVLGGGWYHYPRSVPHGSETLRGRVSERRTLPLLGLGRGCSQRTQRAFGTAMRLCASLFRGVAAPPGCVIPLPFLSPHRRVSRFHLAASFAHRKLSACSLLEYNILKKLCHISEKFL